ncbi:hypothetical protein CYQ56_09750 [Enterococcus faecium]|nr:hypothetical protein CYQ56_09750 [Enterococcus faecium]
MSTLEQPSFEHILFVPLVKQSSVYRSVFGERAEVGVKSVEKETQPPKAFTEGTLLTAMKTANKNY